MRVIPFAPNRTPGKFHPQEILSAGIRGKLGTSNGLGFLRFGASKYGDDKALGGIYQRRKLSKDRSRYDAETRFEYPFIRMRSYRPTYSSSPAVMERREAFAQAVAWADSLTPEEMDQYRHLAASKNMNPRELAISYFLRYYDEEG